MLRRRKKPDCRWGRSYSRSPKSSKADKARNSAMVSFRNASIRSKITILTVLMGVSLLVITTGAFVITEVRTFRHRLVQELTTLADVVGANSTGAISFSDQKLAEQTLGALRAVPHLLAAEIYTPAGQLFAR